MNDLTYADELQIIDNLKMNFKNHGGSFIVFEGIDNSGKTTQANLFSDLLINKGFDVLLTKEPSDTPFGKQIRNILLHQDLEIDTNTQTFLFYAERVNHCENVVIPALNDGKIVICDRFLESTYAYQSEALPEILYVIEDYLDDALVHPSMTYYFKISAETAEERATEKDYMEQRVNWENIITKYDQLFSPSPFHSKPDESRPIINANQSILTITQEIYDKFINFYKDKKFTI